MRKKAGIVLCIIGAVLVTIAVIMLLITPVRKDEQNDDRTEAIQETKDEKQSGTPTKHQGKANQTASEEQADSDTDNIVQPSTEQSAHDINPEVYEWSLGNTFYQDWEEPKLVVEFAKYKEYYEQIAEQFLKYEGKNVDFYADKDMLHFNECKNEGSVKVNCDNEKVKELLENGRIYSISVESDYIIFNTDISEKEIIMYFYDETLTYNDPLPSEKDDLISDYWMVDIAPHWWWKNYARKGI